MMNRRNTLFLAILAAIGLPLVPGNAALAQPEPAPAAVPEGEATTAPTETPAGEGGAAAPESSVEDAAAPAQDAAEEPRVPTTAILADEGGSMGEIGIGLGYLSEDSFRLGRFTGIDSKGLYPDLSLDLQSRTSYLDEDPAALRLEARNLGLDSTQVMLSAASQGRYSAFAYFRGLPNLAYPDSGTPFLGAGTRDLTLPPTGSFGTLGANLREMDIETQRTRVGLGGRVNLTSRWRTSLAIHHERKEGTKLRGVGEHWGLQSATLVPAPVDYDTTRVEADLTYDGEDLQTRLGYMVSVFSQDGSDRFNIADPHAPDWATAPVRQDSLEPDNQFHQVSANLAYSLGETTRLGADLSVGKMQQNAQFINDGSVITDRSGNPVDSLDGEIDTRMFGLRASTRPFDRLTLRASYRDEERDNNTPELVVDAGPMVNYTVGFQCAGSQCITRPISSEQRRVNAEAELRLVDRTYLTLAYTDDERERTYEDREKTEEETYEARLRSRWSFGTVTLNHRSAEQRGSVWERETLPIEIRKYYLADRDRTSSGIQLTATPFERVQGSLRGEWLDDDYIASELGLTSAQRVIYSFDVAYFPTDRLQTYLFYSFEQRDASQRGIDAGTPWRGEREDETFTVGIGGEYALFPGLLTVGAEGVVVETVGKMDVIPAVGASAPYPDLKSTLGLFSLYGDWTLSERLSLRMRYMVEQYDEDDWAVDGVGVTSVSDLILLDRTSPNYTAHLVAATLRYRF